MGNSPPTYFRLVKLDNSPRIHRCLDAKFSPFLLQRVEILAPSMLRNLPLGDSEPAKRLVQLGCLFVCVCVCFFKVGLVVRFPNVTRQKLNFEQGSEDRPDLS